MPVAWRMELDSNGLVLESAASGLGGCDEMFYVKIRPEPICRTLRGIRVGEVRSMGNDLSCRETAEATVVAHLRRRA